MKNYTETQNYIIKQKENGFELLRKIGKKTMFMKSCQFQTPLIVAANKLEEKFI